MAVPPNLDPAIAKQVIEYLKANPEVAQQSYEQAHRMLHTPGMAQMMLDAKVTHCMHAVLAAWGHTSNVPCMRAADERTEQPGAHGQDDAAEGRRGAETGV